MLHRTQDPLAGSLSPPLNPFSPNAGPAPGLTLRSPRAEDGARIHALIAACPPLDGNSLYCNLLQCTHFAPTCIVAEREGALVGWISAYRPPGEPETLFIWQVAVASDARGQGLALQLITALLGRASCAGVRQIKTTITPENGASWGLFRRLARTLQTDISDVPWFLAGTHFNGHHASEHLVTIGPFLPISTRQETKERRHV